MYENRRRKSKQRPLTKGKRRKIGIIILGNRNYIEAKKFGLAITLDLLDMSETPSDH